MRHFVKTQLLSLLCVVALFILMPRSLPGAAVAPGDMDAIVALGCGQNPSTTGQSDCTGGPGTCSVDVIWNGAMWGTYCTDEAASCGSCSGGTNITCQGTIDPADADLCYMYPVVCCEISTQCVTNANEMPEGAMQYVCNCSSGLTRPAGERSMSKVQYSAPGCGHGS